MKATSLAILLVFLAAVTPKKKFDADYCASEMKCVDEKNQPMEHLLCKFKHETSKGDCTNVRGRMTPEERMYILAFHNFHRNEFGMDPSWTKYPPAPEDAMFARREPDCWLTGFWGALCIREVSWAYDNEKAAQIWAEQCGGDSETYNCITDFKEGFPQIMSVYTTDGTVNGEKAMFDAFDSWRKTNLTMKGNRKQPGPDQYSSAVYDENHLDDFKYDATTTFLPWAIMTYWRMFIMGCGKAHYRKGGQDKTRIVCVYGPGVNYIEVLRRRKVKDGGALYVKPNNLTGGGTRQCRVGEDDDPVLFPDDNYRNSCPFMLCVCRGAYENTYSLSKRFIEYGESSWPWLCATDCQKQGHYPAPIPSLMDYITGAGPSLTYSVHALLPLHLFCSAIS